MADFVVGDLVRLKSGGPVMTVQGVSSNGDPSCVWFTSTWSMESKVLPAAAVDRRRVLKPGEYHNTDAPETING